MSKYLLILDAGHAKDTKGKKAFDNSLYEWEFNNKMQYLLKWLLQAHFDYSLIFLNHLC